MALAAEWSLMRQLYALFLIYIFLFPLAADARQMGPLSQDYGPAAEKGPSIRFADEPLQGQGSSPIVTGITPPAAAPAALPPSADSLGNAQDARTLVETAQEAADRAARQSQPKGVQPPVQEPAPQGFLCQNSGLSPNENQNIIDLLKTGFTGKEIAGQTEKNADRDKLAANKLVLENPNDENSAVKVDVPSLKFKPKEISQFLNTFVDGPFSFGVVLDDSLRAGRCEDPASPGCTLTGPNLKYRNSGAGIVADLKPVAESAKELKEYFIDGNASLTQFSKSDNDALKAALATDANDTQLKSARRTEKKLIPNTILAGAFDARLETNCSNSSCVISTYSLFDKYFNSWMSTQMVVTTFGPSLLYQTKKLFGWTGRRGFLSGVKEGYHEFLDRFRKRLVTPESFLGRIKQSRIYATLNKHAGWREWYKSLTGGNFDGSGYKIVKTEEFQHYIGEMLGKDGFISGIKSAEERADFIKVLKDLRSLTRSAEARVTQTQVSWQEAAEIANKQDDLARLAGREPDSLSPERLIERQKHLEYGQDVSWWMTEFFDDTLDTDVPEWIVRHPNTGFFDKGVLQVRSDGGSEVVDLYTEHRNMQRILQKFRESGTFRDFEKEASEFNSAYQSRGEGLVLYTFDRDSISNRAGLSYSNLKAAEVSAARRPTFIEDTYGKFLPYNSSSVPAIQSRLAGQNASIVEGRWKEAGVMSPHEFIDRITNARVRPNLNFATKNVQQMLDAVQERNFVSRRYWNALDKLAAQEDELIRSYFTVKGGAKWTTLPFGYWWAKRGFGIEGISQYMLPDTWHRLKVTHGSENIYDYSYVDFFANEGSDQGDLFIQVINKLPWKIILDELSQKYNPVKNLYDSITKNELRSEAENLAFYLTGPEDCVNCRVVIRSEDQSRFRPFFTVEGKKLTSYILEDTVSDKAKAAGQTLIAFAGHTNLVGQSGSEKGEPIDLVKAVNDKKTCADAVRNLNFYGVNVGRGIPDALAREGRIGAVLGTLESVTYATFFWAGIFSTAAIQVVLAPQLNDCVDADEGYYIHYFVPVKEKQDKQSGTSQKSTENVQKLVDKFKTNYLDTYKGDQNSAVKEATEKLGSELDKFVNTAKDNDLVQATLNFSGTSSGQMDARDLFYFWAGKGAEITPAVYKDTGSMQVRGSNDVNLGIDFAKGQITQNGVPIVQSPDNVRLASTNLKIPAIEIPQTVTQTCLEGTHDAAFSVNAQGEVRVLNPELLSCIRNGVLEQTGLTLDSDKLNDAFGALETIVTTTHPNVRPTGDGITAEGIPRKVAQGRDATITIYADRDVNLSKSNDGDTSLGKLQSIQFKNGVIVVKPNGCFLTWLKHHEAGILDKSLVEGIRPRLERQPNPETGCAEPAINLQAISDNASDFKSAKVDQFNQALAHQGPFQVFETPTQRFIISSEPNAKGVCEDHLRVVDKATGKVTDYVGQITQTPEGLRIKTNDGQVHDLKFSTKDGAPFVQLDSNKPEVLTAAQGKNGSFYYNPDTGQWYAENAQLLPLIQAFRDGIAARVQPNGETTATASGNVLNVDLGAKDSGFLNLPSLPQDKALLLAFMSMLVVSFAVMRRVRQGEGKKPRAGNK